MGFDAVGGGHYFLAVLPVHLLPLRDRPALFQGKKIQWYGDYAQLGYFFWQIEIDARIAAVVRPAHDYQGSLAVAELIQNLPAPLLYGFIEKALRFEGRRQSPVDVASAFPSCPATARIPFSTAFSPSPK